MATKESTKKTTRKPKATKPSNVMAEYRGATYEVLEQNEQRICLTDGTIHFWAKAKDVTVR